MELILTTVPCARESGICYDGGRHGEKKELHIDFELRKSKQKGKI